MYVYIFIAIMYVAKYMYLLQLLFIILNIFSILRLLYIYTYYLVLKFRWSNDLFLNVSVYTCIYVCVYISHIIHYIYLTLFTQNIPNISGYLLTKYSRNILSKFLHKTSLQISTTSPATTTTALREKLQKL